MGRQKMVGGELVDLTPEQEAQRDADEAAHAADIATRASLEYRLRREEEYPSVGDQLDAIWMQLNKDRLDGKNLIQDADNMLGDILSVKARHPKPSS